MTVRRLRDIPGIGVDTVGDRADRLGDPSMLRLENLDTDIRPPAVALEVTRQAVDRDDANSYLPFQGARELRSAVTGHVRRLHGLDYDPGDECLITAGGLNGILNVLLATVEVGSEVVLLDPIYAGLVNRVRLAGGVPRFVHCEPTPEGWRTDPGELAAAVGADTAAVLLMSPAMPTGAVLDDRHWDALATALDGTDAWVIYDAAMERIRFDGLSADNPASHPGLRDRTVTVGAASKELRMIGWRVGWVLGPSRIIHDVNLVGLSNVVCQVGIAQQAVAAALDAPDADADVAAAVAQWKSRAELLTSELRDYGVIPPAGGWSVLLDTATFGRTPAEASAMLFEAGGVAATPMPGWGPSGEKYLRLVYANEPVERLADIRHRFDVTFHR